MVGISFGIITRQAIDRSTFTSLKDLISAIYTYIDGWNERCQPLRVDQDRRPDPREATSGPRSSSFTRN
jgi:hypothetical protein